MISMTVSNSDTRLQRTGARFNALHPDFTRMFKGFVFDLDGTLADTFADLQTAINAVRADMGFGPLDMDTVRDNVGHGAVQLIRGTLGVYDSDREQSIVAEFRRYYRRHMHERTVLYPGVEKTLSQLSGHRLAVLSNKPHDATVELVRRLGIFDRFVEVRGLDDRFPAKPDPTALNYIVNDIFGLEPAQVVMVGDFDTDVLTARNSGVRSVVVRTGMHTHITQTPDWYINDISELSSQA